MVFLSADLHSLIEAYFTINYGIELKLNWCNFLFFFYLLPSEYNKIFHTP